MKILIVEDDIDLNDTLKDFLQNYYEVVSVFSAEDGFNYLDVDLIIADVKLPDMDGFNFAREVREIKDIPIIFLTSLNTQKDIEKGFLSGADDYITKPFSLKELLLRIEAILRRIYKNNKIEIDKNTIFDLDSLTLIKNGETIYLKPKIAKLLKFFLKNRGRVVSKDEIIQELYGLDEGNINSIKTFINTIRNLIGKEKIKTIKNIGYQFVN